jgi:hypothetical protein
MEPAPGQLVGLEVEQEAERRPGAAELPRHHRHLPLLQHPGAAPPLLHILAVREGSRPAQEDGLGG